MGGGRIGGRGKECTRSPLAAGQIISKSCRFSQEAEFTCLIFYLIIRIFLSLHHLCKVRTPFFKRLRTGLHARSALAGQIISKSCIFSPETEFTRLILVSKSEFSYDLHHLCKVRTPFFKRLCTGHMGKLFID